MIKLNASNFSYFAFHPKSSKLSTKDQNRALAATVAMGVLTLGLGHLVCKIVRKCKKIDLSDKENRSDNTIAAGQNAGEGYERGLKKVETSPTVVKTDETAKTKIQIPVSPPITAINPSYDLKSFGRGKHKTVYRVNNTDLVVKALHPIRKGGNYSGELLAYLISQNLGLDVVPRVALVNAGNLSDDKIFNSYPGLKEKLNERFPEEFLIIQKFIPNEVRDDSIVDIQRAHKVLFFNLIAGRSDSKDENSGLDEKNLIWEIDNDQIGGDCCVLFGLKHNHWLGKRKEVWDAPISNELIQHVLSLKAEDIAKGINMEEFGNDIEQIQKNLAAVQKGIRYLKAKPTFEDLVRGIRRSDNPLVVNKAA